jgi:hypothetical protein
MFHKAQVLIITSYKRKRVLLLIGLIIYRAYNISCNIIYIRIIKIKNAQLVVFLFNSSHTDVAKK